MKKEKRCCQRNLSARDERCCAGRERQSGGDLCREQGNRAGNTGSIICVAEIAGLNLMCLCARNGNVVQCGGCGLGDLLEQNRQSVVAQSGQGQVLKSISVKVSYNNDTRRIWYIDSRWIERSVSLVQQQGNDIGERIRYNQIRGSIVVEIPYRNVGYR